MRPYRRPWAQAQRTKTGTESRLPDNREIADLTIVPDLDIGMNADHGTNLDIAADPGQGAGQVGGEPQAAGQQHGRHRLIVDHRGDLRGEVGDDALDLGFRLGAVARFLAAGGPRVFSSEGNLNNRVGVPMTLLGLAPERVHLHRVGVGGDFDVLKDIVAMYKADNKPAPAAMETSVFYNRGVMVAALHVEAARNAIKAKGGAKPTSEDVKKGMESVKGFTLGGLVPPMAITPEDHEGGGWVQIWSVKGGKFVKTTDWQQAYRDVIKKHLADEAKK